jgi:hypothetical protein
LKVIEHDELDLTDCGFFCTRKYRIPAEFNVPAERTVDVDFFDDMKLSTIKQCFLQAFKIFSNRSVIKKVDHTVDDLTENEPFELYLFHGREYCCDLLVTHKNCQHFSYLEEGTLAYSVFMDINRNLSPLKKVLLHLFMRAVLMGRAMIFNRDAAYDFSLKKFRTVYCSNELAFPGCAEKTVVGMPFSKTTDHPEDLQYVIVFDGGIVSNENQKISLRKNFEHVLQQGGKKIYCKFHPGFSEAVREDYRQYFKLLQSEYDIEVAEMPLSACLENIAYTLQDKLSLYVICSSVGVYAALCGSKVYCTAKVFIENSPKLQNFFRVIPEKLFEKFTFI